MSKQELQEEHKTLDPHQELVGISKFDTFISDAIKSNLPIETMSSLLAMRKELKTDEAKEEFFKALAKFQALCPDIPKSKIIKDKRGGVRSHYSPLDATVKIVAPILEQCGLSYTVKTVISDDYCTSSVEVHHVMGHTETSSFPVPIDKDAFMNDSQKAGSARTYARRYAFEDAFGIMTTDEDDDGASLGSGQSAKELYIKFCSVTKSILNHSETIHAVKNAILENDLHTAVEALYELTSDELQSIWIAPTKGGPFTTDELKTIKSNEWHTVRKEVFPEKD